MAQKYGFFNSVNHDRTYDASDVASFLSKFFTNGIFNNSLIVSANDNMTVNVATGSANINGYGYENTEALTLDIDEADDTLGRIDSVIVRLDLNNRQITTMILEGEYASNPAQPSIVRTGSIYDLRLANISVPANTTRITADMITDTRFTSDCGNVTQAVLSLNTEDIFNQYETIFNNWLRHLQDELDENTAGHLQNEINDLVTVTTALQTSLTNTQENIRTALGLATDTYDSTQTYNKGDIKIHDHKLYECNTNNTTGDWDSTKWDLVPIIKNS